MKAPGCTLEGGSLCLVSPLKPLVNEKQLLAIASNEPADWSSYLGQPCWRYNYRQWSEHDVFMDKMRSRGDTGNKKTSQLNSRLHRYFAEKFVASLLLSRRLRLCLWLVCQQVNSRCGRNLKKSFGGVGCVTSIKWLDFGGDLVIQNFQKDFPLQKRDNCMNFADNTKSWILKKKKWGRISY